MVTYFLCGEGVAKAVFWGRGRVQLIYFSRVCDFFCAFWTLVARWI